MIGIFDMLVLQIDIRGVREFLQVPGCNIGHAEGLVSLAHGSSV